MSKNKLAKFADMATYPHVFEAPFSVLEKTPFAMQGKWDELFFKNGNPIILELGCGRGEYTIGLAHRFPEINFIGVDIKGSRMWSGATTALKESLTNVAFLRTNIECIDRFFAPGEVSAIWLTFSDPQMKKVSKRLTSTHFLNRYRRFLIPDGRIHVKTDSLFLFTYTRYLIEKNKLPLCYCSSDIDDQTEIKEFPESLKKILQIRTYYEQQWLARGIQIKYLEFTLPQQGVLEEPEVKIELDEYRSYNRHKRSELQSSY